MEGSFLGPDGYLEKRAEEQGGELSPEAMQALRHGWYLGDETFRDRLLSLIEKPSSLLKKKGSHAPASLQSHGEGEAEKIVKLGLDHFDLQLGSKQGQPSLRKGDPRKVAIAILVKTTTSVGNQWVADRLEMGHNRSVSRLIREGKQDPEIKKLCRKFKKMLPCEDCPLFPSEEANGLMAY